MSPEHIARAREIAGFVSSNDEAEFVERAIAQALAEQQEKDARIAENDHCHLVAAAIRAGGGNERAP